MPMLTQTQPTATALTVARAQGAAAEVDAVNVPRAKALRPATQLRKTLKATLRLQPLAQTFSPKWLRR